MLSGVSAQTQDRLREQLLETLGPSRAQRLKRLGKCLDTLKQARGALHQHSERLIDFRSARELDEAAS